MADDDDDDDSFGEFTFAFNPTTVNTSYEIAGGDDDWGDFSFSQINTTDHNVQSPQPHTETQPKWEKIQGALPLSFFGGGEEEETYKDEKPAMPVAEGVVIQSSVSGNAGFVSNKNNDKRNTHQGINDLVANLYGQKQQQLAIKAPDNTDGLDFPSTPSMDPLSNSASFSSFSSNPVAPAAGNHGSDDEGGWEFIDAYSDSKFAQIDKDNKERSEKTVSPLALQDGSFTDLFAASSNDLFVESTVTADSGFDSKPFTNVQNGYTADFKSESNGSTNDLKSNSLGGSFSIYHSFGDFDTAFMEQASKKKELFDENNYQLGSRNASQGSVDLFAFPNGGSHKYNNGFDFSQSSVAQNGVDSDLFSQTEWKETKDFSDSQPPATVSDDENFGKFEIAFSEASIKPEGSETRSKSYKEPVPLSIFGIEEDPEADNSLNFQEEFFESSTHGKHHRSQSSNLSDILSDLYSQAEPINSGYHEKNTNGNTNLMHSNGNEYNSHVMDDDDDDDNDGFDDGSWEFKDASPQLRVENQNLSFETKLNNIRDFCSSLKDDLCVVARRHLHDLEEAQTTATLAGEEMKVAALDKEIQEAVEELHEKDIISTEVPLDDHSEQVVSFKQYIETLQQPDVQLLESEYHVSRRLSLAESDLRAAIDLINHLTTVLKILTLAPKGEPASYVSIWYKVVSVCSQELKHGTWIWKQSLEKNVHTEILTQQQGKEFIVALGEIYRSVVILEAAVKFYKPWILLSGTELNGICGLLEECHSLWSTSGLDEVIPATYLLNSISHIKKLDELDIANEVVSQEESQCRLSLLSPGIVPEMKMVIWNGDNYFVALANLWANLINPHPPKLSIHVG